MRSMIIVKVLVVAALLAAFMPAPTSAATAGLGPRSSVDVGRAQRHVGAGIVASRATSQSWHFDTKPMGTFNYSLGPLAVAVPTGCFLSISVLYDEKTAAVADAKAGTDCIGPMAANPGWFCNTRATFSWYDTRNRRYNRFKTRLDTGCRTYLLWRMPYSLRGKHGKLVVRFYVDGKKRATNTMSIHS